MTGNKNKKTKKSTTDYKGKYQLAKEKLKELENFKAETKVKLEQLEKHQILKGRVEELENYKQDTKDKLAQLADYHIKEGRLQELSSYKEDIEKFNKRILRIEGGHFIVALLLVIITACQLWYLGKQNDLFKAQNDKIGIQANLQEAERRGSLVFLFSNIMDALDNEIKLDFNKNEKRDISSILMGRIIALSNVLKPYKYLDEDVLITKPQSPERGQLLTNLVESKLELSTYDKLWAKSSFRAADLSFANLGEAYLKGINLTNANLQGAEISKANFSDAILDNVVFTNEANKQNNMYGLSTIMMPDKNDHQAIFSGAQMRKCQLEFVRLPYANFSYATLDSANLSNSILTYSDFNSANLTGANLEGAYLVGANFIDANLRKVDLRNADISDANVSKDFFSQLESYGPDSIIGLNQIFNMYELDSLTSWGTTKYVLKKQGS